MLIKQGDRLINSRNWTELVKPEKITRDESSNSMHGRFVCEPLERGFGTTIGNALRRVLLSSLQGAAFVSVKITGVQHEFSSIHGVLEDVTDIILKVSYSIEQARVGQMTNYDRLILEVWTDGSVTPEDAIAYSAKIIKDQISVFINFDERVTGDLAGSSAGTTEISEKLFMPIDELELSVRATNCLRSANISTVGELVQRTESDMLKTKNFGRKSLDEIKNVLLNMGFDFGMKLDNFDKKYQEWKKQRDQQNEA